MESRYRWAIAAIALSAILAFGTGLRWGLPQAANSETVQPWALDTIAPIAPLNEAYNRFTRAGNEYVVYPLFHYVVLAGAYAPYVGLKLVTGELSSPSSSFPYGIEDVVAFCQDLTILARLVSLLMALGLVAAVYAITQMAASRPAALWAAAAATLIAPLAYYAKTSNLDVPYSFWVLLAIWRFMHILESNRLRDYVMLGAFTALGVATKDQAYGFFLAAPFVLAFAGMRSRPDPASPAYLRFGRALFSKPMLAGGIAAALTYAMANNLFLGGLDGLIRHFSYGGEIYDFRQSDGDGLYTLSGQAGLLGRTGMVFVQMLGPVSIALAGYGVVLSFRQRQYRALVLLTFLLSYYVFVIAAFNLVFSRYLLVPALLLTPFFGIAASHLMAAAGARRLIAGAAVSLALATQVFLVANLNVTLVRDSRYAMEAWIRENVPRGAIIESQVRERMLPYLSSDYDVRVAGNSENTITMAEVGDELTAGALAARNPDYVLVLRDLGVTGDPAGWDDPSLVRYFEMLMDGQLGYRTVAEFRTPSALPFRQIPGTSPTSILLQRIGSPD